MNHLACETTTGWAAWPVVVSPLMAREGDTSQWVTQDTGHKTQDYRATCRLAHTHRSPVWWWAQWTSRAATSGGCNGRAASDNTARKGFVCSTWQLWFRWTTLFPHKRTRSEGGTAVPEAGESFWCGGVWEDLVLECGVTCFCMTEGVCCCSTCDVAARGVTHRETTSTKPSGRRGGAGRCRRDEHLGLGEVKTFKTKREMRKWKKNDKIFFKRRTLASVEVTATRRRVTCTRPPLTPTTPPPPPPRGWGKPRRGKVGRD